MLNQPVGHLLFLI